MGPFWMHIFIKNAHCPYIYQNCNTIKMYSNEYFAKLTLVPAQTHPLKLRCVESFNLKRVKGIIRQKMFGFKSHIWKAIRFIQASYEQLDHVNSGVLCKVALFFISFAASVALERLFLRVRPHVALQLTRRSGSKDALVTLEWLFACVVPHRVNF